MSGHLRGHTPDSLVAAWPDLPLSLPVARRIVDRVVAQDRDDLDGVRGLSLAAARELRARGRTDRLELVEQRESCVDPFVKYLFRAADGSVFEAVRIPLDRPRWSVCVSSQAGCALGCSFCETGKTGLSRNLEAWEIIDQVLSVKRLSPERPVTSVVFQGQGEPFSNYDAVIRAARILRDPNGLRIRGESVTISTVGILPAIERFASEGHVHKLVLSLHSAFDEKRRRMIPAASRWSVEDLTGAMVRLAHRRDGTVHVAWTLVSGVNTGEDEAEALARLFRDVRLRVSLIDVNDPSGALRPPGDAERGRFLEALRARGIFFMRRYSGGPDIHAACGMLAGRRAGGRVVPA